MAIKLVRYLKASSKKTLVSRNDIRRLLESKKSTKRTSLIKDGSRRIL